MKTKNKISGYMIRGASIVVVFSSAIIGFTWAVNLPNGSSDLSWHSAEIAKPSTQTRTLKFADASRTNTRSKTSMGVIGSSQRSALTPSLRSMP